MIEEVQFHKAPHGFPSLPTYSAQWRAIRFELSPGTGEWLTSHIAARDSDGFHVVQVLRPALLRAMFGSQAKQFQALLDFVERALETYLAGGGDLSKWSGPIEGVSATDTKIAYARHGRAQALKMAARQSTVLCSLDDLDLPLDATVLEEESRFWVNRIKEAVTEQRPDLEIYFDKYGVLYRDSVRFGFLTESAGAHFANLLPTSLAQSMRTARGKLQELRTGAKTMHLTLTKLIAGVPRSDDITVTDRQLAAGESAMEELRQEAAESDIGIAFASSHQQAADLVIALA